MRRVGRRLWLGTPLLIGLLSIIAVSSAAGSKVRTASSYVCHDSHSWTRDPTDPLALPVPPGSNPLNGANFFVDGPAHGAAAGAIATLLGLNPKNFPDDYSWAQFQQELSSGRYAAEINGNPSLAFQVHNLEKIASQPESQRLSAFSAGGSPSGVYNQGIKILCHNLTADPGSVALMNTYFLHPAVHGCPTPGQLRRAGGLFRARVNAVARATGNHPAVYLVELDGIGSSKCVQKMGSLRIWEADLRYEALRLQSLPHTVVYLEAGYSDGNSARYTARVLNAAGIRHIRGFWTNDTHMNWTIDEIRWGNRISRMTGGAHFVINTAQNGNGPKRNPHPTFQGNEDLCNPPGRAMGPRPTTATGFGKVDAFLWSSPPGNSSGSCSGGTPAGTFWATRAIQLAANANGKLGPGYPREPY